MNSNGIYICLSKGLDRLLSFETIFGKPVESFLDEDEDLELNDGRCDTPEKIKSLAIVLVNNYEIEGWSGVLR